MRFYAIYDRNTLSILSIYHGDQSLYDGSPSSDPHIIIPNSFNPYCAKIERNDDGTVVVIEDEKLKQSITQNAWNSLRNQRNTLLQQSDWTVMHDSPLSSIERTQWIEYRQRLRDLPSSTIDPANVAWPSIPDKYIK